MRGQHIFVADASQALTSNLIHAGMEVGEAFVQWPGGHHCTASAVILRVDRL
jgi:hypothetical protein